MNIDPNGKETIPQAFPLVSNPRQLKAGQAGRWRVPGGFAFGVGKGNAFFAAPGEKGLELSRLNLRIGLKSKNGDHLVDDEQGHRFVR